MGSGSIAANQSYPMATYVIHNGALYGILNDGVFFPLHLNCNTSNHLHSRKVITVKDPDDDTRDIMPKIREQKMVSTISPPQEKHHEQLQLNVPPVKKENRNRKTVNKLLQKEQVEPVAPEEPATVPQPSSEQKKGTSIIADQLCEAITPTRPKCTNRIEAQTAPETEQKSEQFREKLHEQVCFSATPKKVKNKNKVIKLLQREKMEPVKPSAPEESATAPLSCSQQKRDTSIIADRLYEPVTPTQPKWSEIMKAPSPPILTPAMKIDLETDPMSKMNSEQDEKDEDIITCTSKQVCFRATPMKDENNKRKKVIKLVQKEQIESDQADSTRPTWSEIVKAPSPPTVTFPKKGSF